MPNGISKEYNAAWCDERHSKIDEAIGESKTADKSLAESMEALKDGLTTRMSSLEAKVAKIMGGVGVILVLIEVASKLLGGGGN